MITFAVYNTGGFSASDILMGLVFFGTYMLLGLLPDGKKGPTEMLQDSLYSHIHGRSVSDSDYNKKLNKSAGTVTFIWTVLYVVYMGGRINRDLDNPLFRAVYTIITVMGLYVAMFFIIRCLITRILSVETVRTVGGFDAKIWLGYTLIIFLFMIPLFLLNYPGTMTVDSFDQLDQARGLAAYSDHHPWVHTMIIKALYSLGFAASGSVYGGIATYTLFQMLVVAMAASYAIETMTEGFDSADIRGRKFRILMVSGFVLYPYNLAYSITMWKDVLFSAAVLVLTVTVYRMYVIGSEKDDKRDVKNRDIILFVISSLGMCLLRHNGLYAYILTMMIIFIYECVYIKKGDDKKSGGKRLLKVLVATIATLMAVVLVLGPVQRAYNVEAGDFAHNIPIPLQQIGRVVYDRCKLTDKEWESIGKINTVEYIWEEYTPGGADPMMQWVVFGDGEYLKSHKAEYIALWLRLGIRYPEEYLRAYIDQTRGYYTPMAPEQTEYYGILPNAGGLEPKPVLGAGIRIKIDEICGKLHGMIPVYGILYSMGACFMLLILGMAVCILQNRKCKILAYLPVLTLTLTLLIATPLCADLRYAYPLMLCMPMLICATISCDEVSC